MPVMAPATSERNFTPKVTLLRSETHTFPGTVELLQMELPVGEGGGGDDEPPIENAALPEVPPPGAGLNTVTCAIPAVRISTSPMAARNCVVLTNVVVRLAPFHLTTEPLTNPDPFTVRVNGASPTVMLAGSSELIAGMGLFSATV